MPKHFCKTPEDNENNAKLFQAVSTALLMALSKANSELREARIGCEDGYCDINVNRDILTADGWWLGIGETGPTDKTINVIRFESLDRNPIAILFCANVQPSVMDGSEMANGGRQVSADLAGAASRFLEHEYGDQVTAIFCLGTAADQAPSFKSKYNYVDKDGHAQTEDLNERGYIFSEMLGKRLGFEVLRVSESIECQPLDGPIINEKYLVHFAGQIMPRDIHSIRPTKVYEFLPAEGREEPVEIIKLGDVVLVCVRPELSCLTAAEIKRESPLSKTLVLTLVNGGAKYMADQGAYERITYEAMNSPFARGSAELLVKKVQELLGP